jgi:hypothetical protein
LCERGSSRGEASSFEHKDFLKINKNKSTMSKTLENQWYRGDETVTISSQEYILMKVAIEQSLSLLSNVSYPEVKGYVNVNDGTIVDKPTDKQVKNREVVYTVIPERTFSPQNRLVSYDGKVTEEILGARELIMIIHQRNIESGITSNVEDLNAEYEANKVESKLEIV